MVKPGEHPRFDIGLWARRRSQITGVHPSSGRLIWQPWEHKLLEAVYPDYATLGKLLPHRTLMALQARARTLDLPKKHGRSLRPSFNKKQLAILRLLYCTVSKRELEATCEAAGIRYPYLQQLASKRGWHRPRQPYVLTGILTLDNLRRRCFAMRVTMIEIDDWTNGKGYFSEHGWRWRGLNQRLIDEAHRVLNDAIPT